MWLTTFKATSKMYLNMYRHYSSKASKLTQVSPTEDHLKAKCMST